MIITLSRIAVSIPLLLAGMNPSSARAEKISTDTGIIVEMVVVENNANGRSLDFYATDRSTGKEYVTHASVDGKHWVMSFPQEVVPNRDFGPQVYMEIGRASEEVAGRFAMELSIQREKFRESIRTQNTVVIDAPGNVPGTTAKNGGRAAGLGLQPSPLKDRSTGVPFPTDPGPANRDSDYDRMRASERPYRVGETLDKMNWDLRSYNDQRAAQNEINTKIRQQVDSDLEARLRSHGVQDAAIKANMLINLYFHTQTASSPSARPVADRRTLTEIQLTEEGKRKIRIDLESSVKNGDWRKIATSATLLSNPWTGDPSDPALAAIADRSGILNGAALKPNTLYLHGRPGMQHRIRQTANRLQAFVQEDHYWTASHITKSVIADVGAAIQSSAVAEKWGLREQAETLLYFAEAGVDFLSGVDTGIKVGAIQLGAGMTELAVMGYSVVAESVLHPVDTANVLVESTELLTDPETWRQIQGALYKTITKTAPALAMEQWRHFVDIALKGSAGERGRLLGRAAFEVASFVLTENLGKILTESATAWRAERAMAEFAEFDAVVNRVDKIATASGTLSKIEGTDYFVRKLPDLRVLAVEDKEWKKIANSFQGHIFTGELRPGDVLYQMQRKGQNQPGSFFIAIRPVDGETAEALANIAKWKNDGFKVSTYVVKDRVSVYAGSVAGGEGHQIMIPALDQFKKLEGFEHFRDFDRMFEKIEEHRLPWKGE